MLQEYIVVYVFCGPTESFLQSFKESVKISNEEERNTISFGWNSDEFV